MFSKTSPLRAAMVFPGLVAVLVLVFVLVNARWIWLYRYAQPLDIDEAGYLIFTMIDYRGLNAGGLSGWLQAIEAPSIQAPLTTALASLIFAVGGPHVVAAFAVPVFAGMVTLVATYCLARCLLPQGPALAVVTLVASCPLVMSYARSFHFALPATATTTIALLCLVRSERFSNVRWVLLFGLSLGLMPLARTMTIAFIPGLVVGAGIYALADEGNRVKRLFALFCALLLAIVTASSWLALNGTYVFHYLFSFGYGKQAMQYFGLGKPPIEYGSSGTALGLSAWMEMLRNLVANIYVPHTLVLLAGLASTPVLIAATFKRHGCASVFRNALISPALPIVVFILEAFVALTSSQNKGTAFVLPIIPAMLVISVYVMTNAFSGRRYMFLLRTCLTFICLISTIPLLDFSWPFARTWAINVPWLGPAIVTDGRGPIQQYEDFRGSARTSGMAQSIDRTEGRAWSALSKTTSDILRTISNSQSVVAFGFRGFLFNTNTVRLQIILAGPEKISLVQVDPFETGDTQSGYYNWLMVGGASASCLLLTLRENKEDIPPPVSKRLMEAAARQAGFMPLQDWLVPDGNIVTLWQRHTSQPACLAS
jgi:4-amino-4-deoxy-L-arabinose transferase-like glycosyltransferase